MSNVFFPPRTYRPRHARVLPETGESIGKSPVSHPEIIYTSVK